MFKKRNRLSNPQTQLEAKAMLAAPAAPAADAPTTAAITTPDLTEAKPASEAPDKLELGAELGGSAQFLADFSADEEVQVEAAARFNADGTFQPDTFTTGTPTSVSFAGQQEPGGSTIHTHPQPTFSADGQFEGEQFLDSDGLDKDGNKPAFVATNGPSGGDVALATAENNRPLFVASGDTTYAHLPNEDGKHRGDVDLSGQRTAEEENEARSVFADQVEQARDNQFEADRKRALAAADRTAGDGKGQLTIEQINEIEGNTSAKASEVAGGTSYVGKNDGSGTLEKNEFNPNLNS